MNIKQRMTGKDDLWVDLQGDFDALGVPDIRQALEAIAEEEQAGRVVMNLTDVDFIDSSGIGAIVFLFKRLKAQQRVLELSGVRNQPKQLLELLRIHQVIRIH